MNCHVLELVDQDVPPVLGVVTPPGGGLKPGRRGGGGLAPHELKHVAIHQYCCKSQRKLFVFTYHLDQYKIFHLFYKNIRILSSALFLYQAILAISTEVYNLGINNQ